MIIVDTALRRRLEDNNPVRVALVGAGYVGSRIARQIFAANPGMRLVAIANRTVSRAESAYRLAGAGDCRAVSSPAQLEKAMEDGVHAVTDDPAVVCRAAGVEAIIETSGDVE